jgi:Flp pilus assembly pilin Flp
VSTKYATSIDIIAETWGILATKEHVEAHPFPAYDAKYGLTPECFDIAKAIYGRMTDKEGVQALGHALLAAGGHHAMVATIYALKHAFKDANDDEVRSTPRLIELWWDGIGGWQG